MKTKAEPKKIANGIETKIGRALDEVVQLSGHERLSAVDAILQAVLSSSEIAWQPDTAKDDAELTQLERAVERTAIEPRNDAREIAEEVVRRARGEAFNNFMAEMGQLDPQGSVRESVKVFQAAWSGCFKPGEFDAFSQFPASGTVKAEQDDVRTQLFEALGIVHTVKRGLIADEYCGGGDPTRLQNSLEVAGRMILGATDRLDSM